MNRNEIYMIQGKDYLAMTKELLEECRLCEQIPSKNLLIGIKPNLVSPSEASWGATTHPEIVAGILEYLQERGFDRIVILEGSWVGDRTADAFDVCGYREICERYGVEFWDMQKDKGIPSLWDGTEISICERVQKIDYLINVPVLKGHCQTKITCALKNMKGLIPNSEKRHFHTMGLHRPIALLNQIIHQDFIIVDNICGDLDFEDGGDPTEMNRIWAGIDPVLIDSCGCLVLGLDSGEVDYLLRAEDLGIGSRAVKEAEFHYLGNCEPIIETKRSRKIVQIEDLVHEVDSCSACYGALMPALARLKEEGILKDQDIRICIGQGYRGKTGVLGIGQCTAGFAHTLKGCPPEEETIYEFLKDYLL